MIRVVCVGCGEPKKGMGWYHLTQLLEDRRAQVVAVVEPWFMGDGRKSAGGEIFDKFREQVSRSHPETKFYASLSEIPDLKSEGSPSKPVLALLAGRTADNPVLFEDVIAKGVTHVIVEKPGAETSSQIEAMQALASKKNVQAVVGYNKNVSDYTRRALEEIEASKENGTSLPMVTLEHNNAFVYGSEDIVNFLQGAGSEGMLHNMACHELATAVICFGLRCTRISSVCVNREESELVQLPSGGKDWVRLTFIVSMQPGNQGVPEKIRFVIDRCGGNFSSIHVGDGECRRTFTLPSADHASWVERQQALEPEVRPYFFLQSPDYQTLKAKMLDHMLAGKPGLPDGLCDLDAALEVLRLADMLKPALLKTWDAGECTWVPDATRQEASCKRMKLA